MNQNILIGLAAGLASALLFAAVAGGGALGLPLRFLSPLPLMIAGLGWGTATSGLAAVAAAMSIGLILSLNSAAVYGLAVALPALVLAHLVGLSRPADPADPQAGREWYPLGRVVLAAALLPAVATLAGSLLSGFDMERAAKELLETYDEMSKTGSVPSGFSRADLERVARAVVVAIPLAASATWTLVHLIDLWLGSLIVRKSGRLARPWEDLAAFRLPAGSGLAFAAAFALTLAPAPVSLLAGPFAGGLLVVFAALGFAVLHSLLRGSPLKVPLLALAYLTVALFGVPLVLVAALGLAEGALRLRDRRLPPPPPPRIDPTFGP